MLPLIHALLLAFSTHSAREASNILSSPATAAILLPDPSRGRCAARRARGGAGEFCTILCASTARRRSYTCDLATCCSTHRQIPPTIMTRRRSFRCLHDQATARLRASLTGTLLRAARYSVEQGGVPSEDAVWWTLRTAPDARADCPGQGRCSGALPGPSASASGETRRLRGGGSKRSAKDKGAVVHRTTKTTPRAVYAASTAMVLASPLRCCLRMPWHRWLRLYLPASCLLLQASRHARDR